MQEQHNSSAAPAERTERAEPSARHPCPTLTGKMAPRNTALYSSPTTVGMSSVCGCGVDTEAGMLPGISRKRSIRSNPYWFTEFCNSQCLSHFAAPFIVVRAETSVAESCEQSTSAITLMKRTDKRYWYRRVDHKAAWQGQDRPRVSEA